MAEENKKKASPNKAMTVVGAILCVILIPILLINLTLIIKSYTNKDDVPKIGGYCPLIVLSGSMEPNIHVGDLIICKQTDPEKIQVDDVIAFFDPESRNNSVLTHRVIEVIEQNGALSFRTMGDANLSEDRVAVPAEKLVGIWTGTRIPSAGNVAMFMQTTAGFVICVVLPLILLVAWDMIRRRRYEKQNQQDTSALLAELEALKAQRAAEQSGENPTDPQ